MIVDNGDGTCKVPLTRGYHAIINSGDVALISGCHWQSQTAKTGLVYACTKVKGRKVYMHRLIAGAPDDAEVDHISHDGLDNRRTNLRCATRHQNCSNMRKRAGTSSSFKGVCLHKKTGRWHAYINARGQRLHLGYFSTERAAADAYNSAAIRLHGDFASLNH